MELVVAGDHDEGDLGVAEDGELPRLLEEPVPPLRVGDLPVGRVLDRLDLNLPPRHLCGYFLDDVATRVFRLLPDVIV